MSDGYKVTQSMQRGIDCVRQAEAGCDMIKKRIAEIDAEVAELQAERAEAIGYMRDVAGLIANRAKESEEPPKKEP